MLGIIRWVISWPSITILVNSLESLCGNPKLFLVVVAERHWGSLSPSLPRPELAARAPLSFFRRWRGGTTVGFVRLVPGAHLCWAEGGPRSQVLALGQSRR